VSSPVNVSSSRFLGHPEHHFLLKTAKSGKTDRNGGFSPFSVKEPLDEQQRSPGTLLPLKQAWNLWKSSKVVKAVISAQKWRKVTKSEVLTTVLRQEQGGYIPQVVVGVPHSSSWGVTPGMFVGAPGPGPVTVRLLAAVTASMRVAGFTLLTVVATSVRVIISLLRNLTWQRKVLKTLINFLNDQLIL